MDAQKTGKLINYLRSKKSLTQKQLAEKINVSDKAVSKWERGDGCPDVALLPALAEVLETDVDSLLKGELSSQAAPAPKPDPNAPRIKFYDFKRPDLFDKNELYRIFNIFQIQCEKMRLEILGNRTDFIGVSVACVDQLTNNEFLRSIPERTFFFNYDYNNSGFAVEVNPQVGKTILKQDLKKYPDLTQSDLDCLNLTFINPFVNLLQNVFYENTAKTIPLSDFKKEQTEAVLLPSTCGERREEMCVLITLDLKSDIGMGTINFQFDYSYLGSFCKKLGLFGKDEKQIQTLTDIKSKPRENNIFVEFGRFLPETVSFEPGSVFVTQKKADSQLNVIVKNELCFNGEAVVVGENFGVRISNVLENERITYDEEHYVALRLGACFYTEEQIKKFCAGTVLELDTFPGNPLSIIVDGKCVAHADVVIIDGFYGIKVCDV